jgi:hypothetical protein
MHTCQYLPSSFFKTNPIILQFHCRKYAKIRHLAVRRVLVLIQVAALRAATTSTRQHGQIKSTKKTEAIESEGRR